jgi:hypothetical protein
LPRQYNYADPSWFAVVSDGLAQKARSICGRQSSVLLPTPETLPVY